MKFLVEIKLPKYKNKLFRSMMPEQQEQIVQWMQENTIDVFTLNVAQTKAWFVVSAQTKEEVTGLVDSFVTRQFMMTVKIEPLMIFDTNSRQLPPLVLN